MHSHRVWDPNQRAAQRQTVRQAESVPVPVPKQETEKRVTRAARFGEDAKARGKSREASRGKSQDPGRARSKSRTRPVLLEDMGVGDTAM